jgi:xylulokinase
MVALDAEGCVVRPALLWNDTRSAGAAEDLVTELGLGNRQAGARYWAEAVGLVPVASFTIAKLRWLVDHEPDHASRLAAVALPHDWLTWRLAGADALASLVTDRSDASGTGYFDAVTDAYRLDLLARALKRQEREVTDLVLPRVARPDEAAGMGGERLGLGHLTLGPGCGDNAGAALGLHLSPGQTMLSLGTSGVVGAVSAVGSADPTGAVAGFADATGNFLPLAVTLNAARVLDATARLLRVDHEGLSTLALAAQSGSGGLVHVPYLEGERTPNLPDASGRLYGMTLASMTRENLARAAVEGLLCHLADALAAVRAQGASIERVTLVGGAARSRAVREIAPAILGVPVMVPAPAEYVADGAARQAAWVLRGSAEAPEWEGARATTFEAPPTPAVLDAYRQAATDLAATERRVVFFPDAAARAARGPD